MRILWRDLRFGSRMLVKSPGFTCLAVLTLALGIGANSAIFSVVNAVLLSPLPWRESGRLVRLWESNPQRGWPRFSTSGPNFLDWVEQNRSFEIMAGWRFMSFNLTEGGEAERVEGGAGSAGLLSMLGVAPALGRGFMPEEDKPGGGCVALLGHALWQRRFESDPRILGRAITIDGEGCTVVGVLQEAMQWIGETDVIVPLGPRLDRNRGNHVLLAFGRLKKGVSLLQAQGDMEGVARRLEKQYPDSNAGWGVATATFRDWIIGPDVTRALFVLGAAVAAVLLIACANVANLMLARAAARRSEIAVRTALGASRFRVVRQLLAECLLLSLIGGVIGLLLAMWGVDLLRTLGPRNIPRLDEVGLDGRALAFTLGLSLLTSIFFGLIPALQASRPDLTESLKDGGRGTDGSSSRQRLRGALVMIEVALSLVLLIGAGLLLRSFQRLQEVDPGFQTQDLLTMQLNLPASKYRDAHRQIAFYTQLLERVRSVPGVQSASVASGIPFGPGNTSIELKIEGRAPEVDGSSPSADWRKVTPEYFRTLGIPIVQGRALEAGDGPDSPYVVVISKAMAHRYWPDQDPIGRRIGLGGMREERWTVVGVSGDVKNGGLDGETRPVIYLSFYQGTWNPMSLAVRATGDPAAAVASVRAAAKEIDPDVPISNVLSMEELMSTSVGPRRFNTLLLAIFAGVALILATVGIYGVMACLVGQRHHEIGVRMALGAQAADIMKLVLRHGMALTLIGMCVGLAAAFGLTRAMTSLLFEVDALDPLIFAGVSLLLAGVSLPAVYFPARRATRVDPLVALKYE